MMLRSPAYYAIGGVLMGVGFCVALYHLIHGEPIGVIAYIMIQVILVWVTLKDNDEYEEKIALTNTIKGVPEINYEV